HGRGSSSLLLGTNLNKAELMLGFVIFPLPYCAENRLSLADELGGSTHDNRNCTGTGYRPGGGPVVCHGETAHRRRGPAGPVGAGHSRTGQPGAGTERLQQPGDHHRSGNVRPRRRSAEQRRAVGHRSTAGPGQIAIPVSAHTVRGTRGGSPL